MLLFPQTLLLLLEHSTKPDYFVLKNKVPDLRLLGLISSRRMENPNEEMYVQQIGMGRVEQACQKSRRHPARAAVLNL